MADREQNYKSHTRFLPPFHFFVIPVLLINFLNEIRHVYLEPSRHTAWVLVVALALLTLGFLSRIQALTVQDRVIRLEERLRLAILLDKPLRARMGELSESQLVALRFASDAELPALAASALANKLSNTEIKKAVGQWRPDYWRV